MFQDESLESRSFGSISRKEPGKEGALRTRWLALLYPPHTSNPGQPMCRPEKALES
jgi:hypothetical protein